MIDFRETMIIESSQSYENLMSENKLLQKKNYLLVGLVISTVVITFYFAYKREQESKKIFNNKSN